MSLRKQDGRVVNVPLTKLGLADRAYGRFWAHREALSEIQGRLFHERRGHQTILLDVASDMLPAPESPPDEFFELVRYGADLGANAAYVTPDPQDGKRRPAILWAHGGFGGLGSFLWEQAPVQNDQSVNAFLKSEIVVMCPSWRGEDDNPGRPELFYGEVDDLLAAASYLAELPYVDPERIYVAGHSTGGTLALLSVTASDRFRAAFSFGGAPDVARVVSNGDGFGNTPFDHRSPIEGRLRSAIHLVGSIDTPTFYFEGEASSYCEEAQRMRTMAVEAGAPFEAYIIQGANHFSILAPLTKLLAEKIVADDGPTCGIVISSNEVNRRFQVEMHDYLKQKAESAANLPVVELSPAAVAKLKSIIRRSNDLSLDRNYVRATAKKALGFDDTYDETKDVLITQDGIRIIVRKSDVSKLRGILIDFVDSDGRTGFQFVDRF